MSHCFHFAGGDDLSRMGAAWFISYAYFDHIDKNHLNWKSNITKQSCASRCSKYFRCVDYHKTWLREVQNMKKLDVHANSVGIDSVRLKEMANQILVKLDYQEQR